MQGQWFARYEEQFGRLKLIHWSSPSGELSLAHNILFVERKQKAAKSCRCAETEPSGAAGRESRRGKPGCQE